VLDERSIVAPDGARGSRECAFRRRKPGLASMADASKPSATEFSLDLKNDTRISFQLFATHVGDTSDVVAAAWRWNGT
jgi:hypothetical protein